MSEIIFAQTRVQYDSYTDYRRLVELSGFPTVFIDEIDLQSDNLYIVSPMNGEFDAHINWSIPRRCRIFHWNLERPGDGTVATYKAESTRRVREYKLDEIIVSDKTLAKITGFRYVPLGSHIDLGTPGLDDKKYDYIHLMCYSPHRGHFFRYPQVRTEINGCRIADSTHGLWGEERHIALQQSKMLLNVHQDKHVFIEPLRFALAAAYGLPIITEQITAENTLYVTFELDMLGVNNSLRHYVTLYDSKSTDLYMSGMQNRQILTGEYSFRRCIERYI